MRRAALLSALLLAGCAGPVITACPVPKAYPPEFSQRLAGELEQMPADSATIQAIGDYIALRDQLRAVKP